MLQGHLSIRSFEPNSEFKAISKTEEAKKGWVIGRNGTAMPRSAYHLSELLEDQRKEAELTKAAFARKIGIPKQTLHRLLNGQANPTIEFVAALADKLDLNFHPTFILPSPRMLAGDEPGEFVGPLVDSQTEKAKKQQTGLE